MIKKLLFTLACLKTLAIGIVFAQGNAISGVSIAEDTIPPHPSAILEVRSTNKGILIPRMTSLLRDQIINPADGLTVYVTDNSELKGLWFFDKDKSKWVHLVEKKPAYPKGAIILYTGDLADFENGKGKKDTKMEGWHICNGDAGTPDLRGRFVVGQTDDDGSEYVNQGPSVNEDQDPGKPHDSFVMAQKNLPIHSHGIAEVHKEGIEYRHDHHVNMISTTHYHLIDKANKDGRPGFDHRGYKKAKKSTNRELDFSKANLKVENPIDATFTFPNGSIESTGAKSDEIEAIDNRPPYYVAVYIMKII